MELFSFIFLNLFVYLNNTNNFLLQDACSARGDPTKDRLVSSHEVIQKTIAESLTHTHTHTHTARSNI